MIDGGLSPPPVKVGVLANEFFAPDLGRVGGFGWAAQQAVKALRAHRSVGYDPVFLTAEVRGEKSRRQADIQGTRLLLKQPSKFANARMIRAERLDLILAIDYRPSYRPLFWVVPRTPVIVWARDPRTPEDVRRIDTLSIPGQQGVRPLGIESMDCTSLAAEARLSRLTGRKILVACKMSHIAAKLGPTYGVKSSHLLPNPDVIDYAAPLPGKSDGPRVVFLARLDPYKRPWLFVELARRFPGVEFLLLGRTHFSGPGSWTPEAVPPNLKVMGHLDGAEKLRLLASAWVLINTSIHEESPVSMLEALACATPILSCIDTGELAPRFGIYTGHFDGTGLEALPALEDGLRRLLTDPGLRGRLGEEGRRWVVAQHNTARFLEAFDRLRVLAGVRRP